MSPQLPMNSGARCVPRTDHYTLVFYYLTHFEAQSKGDQMYTTFWKSDIAAGAMYEPKRNSASSFYTSGNILNQMYSIWAWHDGYLRSEDGDLSGYGTSWVNAMKELAIGLTPWRDVWAYHFRHGSPDLRDEDGQPIPITEQEYSAYGRDDMPATGASTKFAVQDKAGAIFVKTAVSASIAYKELHGKEIDPKDLPGLRSLSDLMWAGWVRGSNPAAFSPDVTNLKYIFMMWVINGETLSVMKRALATKGKDKPSVWPGDDFSVDKEEGQALLGTPNGKPIGYLVNQHKLELGIR